MRATTKATERLGMHGLFIVGLLTVMCIAGPALAQSISADDLEYSWEFPMAPGENLTVVETVSAFLSWEPDGADGSVRVSLGERMPPGLELSVYVTRVSAVEGENCGQTDLIGFAAFSGEALELVNGIKGGMCVEGEAQLEYKLEVVDWDVFRGGLDENLTLVYEYVTN